MVTAMLEDQLPELEVIGVDYAKRMEQIRKEGEEIERRIADAADALEANTITINSSPVPPEPIEEQSQHWNKSKTWSIK
jgi:hypothetical protein